ncbi:hypothetical protein CK203_071874 [Vitis vinifera]|uniref:Guanylate-binding protein/Atlastin C-terminal domain-containing protein n=1 Tax=Vitis vinifera TaxID=29760 RepID=A0A438F3U6_VITVI|nr:hypothetical protein CK203_071874 [Vitis vinifera]
MGGSSNALWKRLFECFIVLSLIGDMGERLNNRSTHEDWDKWSWSYALEGEMLWKQDVEEKHGEEEGGWRSCIGRGGYGVGLWKAIRKVWELFFVLVVVGVINILRFGSPWRIRKAWPWKIREADISRLSFAVELAEEFYGRLLNFNYGQDVAFEPAKLLWLIQRDFLQGKSVQEMVNEALRHVPNYDGDKNIEQVNQIRDSLAIMGDNSTAFSLPQPHLQRTRLCDMKDGELDPAYVQKRDQLKEVVASIIRPKIVQGKPLNGKEFVSFMEQILEALNKGEIPSTGSLVEVFNKGILERCLKLYSERMGKVALPLSEKYLLEAHEGSRGEAMNVFDEQHFGRYHAKKSVTTLDEEIQKIYKNFILANEYQSSKLCEALYTRCEDKMDQLQVLRLPSMAKFNAGFLHCNQSFGKECVGPSKTNYEQRMTKMMQKSRSLFIKEYNHRLFNWLVAFSLFMVVVGRFVIKFILLEIGAWILFIFLETYTRMFWSAESLYYNPVWHFIVATWETLVYSPILDLDRWAIPICVLVAILVLYWRCYGRRKHGSRGLLPLYNNHKGGSNRRRSD